MGKKRFIKDEYRETVNELEIVFSTSEFEEGTNPQMIGANFNTDNGGYYAGNFSVTDKKVSHNLNNISIDLFNVDILSIINNKFKEIAGSYTTKKQEE